MFAAEGIIMPTHRTLRAAAFPLAATSALLACSATLAHAPAADLVIRDVRVLVGDGRVLEEATVAIEGGRIVFVGAGSEAPAGRTSIDGAELTLLPGLIDAHVHLLSPLLAMPGGEEELAAKIAAVVHAQLREYVEHGVTTIMTNGDYWPAVRELRDRVRAGELPRPRIRIVGPILTSVDGKPAVGMCPPDSWCRSHLAVELASPQQARSSVRQLAEGGVDAIKAMVGAEGVASRLSNEALTAIVEEAHAAGLRVYVHPDEASDAEDAVRAGVDALVHPPGLDPSAELLEAIRRGGITVATTLKAPGGRREPVIRAMYDAGITLALGSDMPRRAPWEAVRREMAALSEAGLSNEDIIAGATRNAAEHLGMLAELGTVEPGKIADLLLVRGDPYRDLAALEAVELVIQDGRIVHRGARVTTPPGTS